MCVVLVTEASHSHDSHRQSFRLYAQNSPYSAEKVRFAYIYHDKQPEFVNSLIPGKKRTICKNDTNIFNFELFLEDNFIEPLLRIVILWRRDTSHVKYEWITEKWDLNDTTQKLETTISRLLRSSEALSYEAFVKV